MILRKTKKGIEDVKLDSEYVYDPNVHISQAEFNQDVLDSIPTGTITENPAYIDDSSSFPVKSIAIKGKTNQIITTGKNMLDLPQHYSITYFTTITSRAHITETGSYIVQCGTVIKGGAQSPFLRIGNTGVYLDNNTKTSITLNSIPSTYYVYSNGYDAPASLGVTSIINDLMIYPASITDDSYEPYTDLQPSPSPQYLQPIHNVSGDINVESSNNNILKFNDNVYSGTWRGLSLSISNNVVNISGTTNQAYGAINLFDFKGANYANYLPLDSITMRLSPGNYAAILDKNITGEVAILKQNQSGTHTNLVKLNSNTNYRGTFTLYEEVNIYVAFSFEGSGIAINQSFSIDLEKSSSINQFEPYQGESITFPLSEGQKMYEGDYLADDGIHHVRKQIVLDGTEDWQETSTSNVYYINSIDDYAISNNIPTSLYFKGVINQGGAPSFSNQGDNIIGFLNSLPATVNKRLWIKSTSFNSASELASWLTTNNCILEYNTTNETIEAYTQTQQTAWNQIKKLQTYNNITNFSALSDDLNTVVNIVYYKDLNTILDNLNNAILSQGANV